MAEMDLPKAKVLVEKILSSDQTNVLLLGVFGWFNVLSGKAAKALACFTKALKIDSKHPLVLYGLAVHRERYDDKAKAVQAATKLLQVRIIHLNALIIVQCSCLLVFQSSCPGNMGTKPVVHDWWACGKLGIS